MNHAFLQHAEFIKISLDFGHNLPEFCRNLPKIGGPGKMYGYPIVNPQLPDEVPAVCIFAEGVLYRASQS